MVFVKWGIRTQASLTDRKGPLGWASTTAMAGQRDPNDPSPTKPAAPDREPAPGAAGRRRRFEQIDPLAGTLKADIKAARGRALLVETTSGSPGWDGGPGGAPRRDWVAGTIGASAAGRLVEVDEPAPAFKVSPCLAATGTASVAVRLRERPGCRSAEAASGRWHLGTVLPLARLLEVELSEKLEAAVSFQFDNYPIDLAGRTVSVPETSVAWGDA